MTDDLGAALVDMVARLDAAGIPSMLVGSIAGVVHGRARTTHDVDLVIAPTAEQLRGFVRALPQDAYYCEEATALDALRRASQFNVLDLERGWKFDLMIRKPRPFSRDEFERRRRVAAFGSEVHVASVEDIVLAKLEWSEAAGGSERQIEDVRELVRVAGSDLDLAHIEQWLDPLGVRDAWERVRSG